MRCYRATTPAELDLLPVHDGWFDPDDVRYEPAERVVVVPFLQEALQWEDDLPPPDVPQREFIRESTWYREYRVPLLAACLTVRNAVAVDASDHWGGMGMLQWVEFDSEAGQVVVDSDGAMRVTVTALEVEARITHEIARLRRLRVGKLLGWESDAPWE